VHIAHVRTLNYLYFNTNQARLALAAENF